MNNSGCPQEQLALLIEDNLGSVDTRRVMDHLETCLNCQAEIESLSADKSWWKEARLGLVDAATDADCRLLESASDGYSIDGWLRDDANPNHQESLQIVLDRLDSPSHPEMLGRIDEFEIERVIGIGGMGIVFKGFDHELNRPVAIKAMLPRYASNGSARKRFSREAKAAAAICHENVVAIHRIQSTGDVPYLVMPYVSGESLQSFVDKEGPMPVQDVVRVGIQIASGLSAAHHHGLVHRDIKPANVLLENGCNRVQITDFGLAFTAEDARLTHTGMIAGSPYYMSPEQALGKPVDGRSDLFSLGSVLYFLATGQPPFQDTNAIVVLNLISHSNPPDIREINPDVPKELAFGIHRLLEKSPEERFASAQDVVVLLESLLSYLMRPTQAISPRIRAPKSLPSKPVRSNRARFKPIGWIAIGVLAIAGIVGLSIYRAIDSTHSRPNTVSESEIESLLESVRADVDAVLAERHGSFGPRLYSKGWTENVNEIHDRIDALISEQHRSNF